jgi:hypothetical protein
VSAPSSVSSKEFIGGLYDAFARGDAGAVISALDANIVWNEGENHPYAKGNPFKGRTRF